MNHSKGVAETSVSAVATEPAEFESFYREHLPFVRLYLARRVADHRDVADLTADVFLRVIHAAHSYKSDLGSPRAWLTGVTRNVLGEHRQSQARHNNADQRLLGRRLLDEDSAERIVARIDAEVQARQALAAIADLPPPLRDVVELVAVDGLSLTEAAAVLKIKPGAARVRYLRARRALQHSLDFDAQGATR